MHNHVPPRSFLSSFLPFQNPTSSLPLRLDNVSSSCQNRCLPISHRMARGKTRKFTIVRTSLYRLRPHPRSPAAYNTCPPRPTTLEIRLHSTRPCLTKQTSRRRCYQLQALDDLTQHGVRQRLQAIGPYPDSTASPAASACRKTIAAPTRRDSA